MKFGKALKIVKKYWEAKSGSIYLSFARITYDYFGEYKDKAIQYIVYIGEDKVKDYYCEVTSYII